MPAYGPYETTREIASGHGFIVYAARKAGESKDNYAVKVFALDSFISADAEDRPELDPLVADFDRTFNRSVELQKQAAAVSRCIAPILDVGREEGSAWYATRLYPRTVQKILEGRVALGKEWVHHIIRAIARGALDFKQACGRSHGEIQPSNVLISASQKVRDAEVVLSDPLPGEASEAARYEVADLHAIGQIIYQLVRRREVEDASDHSILPLTPSAEWTSIFGQETDAWLSLCNRLLDPNLSTDAYNLERLEADLVKLEPKPAVTGRMLALAAAAMIAAIVGGVFVVRMLNRGELLITSDPPGTQIQVTDASGKTTSGRTGADGKLKLTLVKGSYAVRAEYPGLGVLTKEDVRVGGEPLPPFVFSYGKVAIDSQPRGATIRIDGTNLLAGGAAAVTPHTFEAFKPGPVTFQLDLKDKGYVQANLSAIIQERRSTNLFAVLVLKQADSGTVEFDSNPLGVIYELNGKPIASNRAQIVSLPQGTYRFVGRYRDIWPLKETNVVLKPNDEAKVKLYFERARISLDSQPSGANVYAGNRPLGVTPTESFLWPLGTARFRFEKPGFEILTLVTNITEDNARIDLVAPLVSTNGIILLTVEQAPAVVRDAATGAEVARTTPGQPKELMREPGRYAYTISAPGFQPITTNLLFVSKEKRPMTVRLPAELIRVAFSADPPGVELFDAAEGGSYGLLDAVNATGLPARNYKFSARQVRYPALGWVTNDVTVVKGQPNAHEFKFLYTTLVLTSTPPELKVYQVLDSGRREYIGLTPTNRPYQPPGRMTLEFIKWDGTQTNRHDVMLRPGLEQVGTYFRPPRPPAYVNSIGLVMEWLPEDGDKGGFWVGKYEVTQPQYETIMGANPSKHGKAPVVTNLPVDSVSLTNALEFCRQLTQRDATSLAQRSLAGWTYALPTTNQWSFFAETTLTNAVIRRGRPEPVHTLGTNDWGLAGVRGNLWEWCVEGVARGGAYDSAPGIYGYMLDFYYPLKLSPSQPFAFDVGFRCLLVPPKTAAQ
jgi:Sulfatase-modifying factor enzyme 1/PEGA domain